ncbi:NAD-dependent epimerase/dehydratase family protein [Nonomuraea phyllanthi]|uniref:NAD-dependent epimerase/dehydratase family protein n=1 Tax=Nonomuraea phyllanthi TaxID=2219224 RepID=A0A5C4VXN7_9ACTN|nr:NAD-dependent epimerase/dehydratase family protein [Nonomuraea phyllanthi]KAB8190569.1 NAD-dependent epimerase/dehydratase family protein [Nonomuraea phyllanthi]
MAYWPGTVVLVTGAAGFIGAHLVKRLRALAAEVHAVSRRPQRSRDGEIWHVADLGDAGATSGLFRSVRPRLVFHLAGEVTGSRGDEVVRATLDNNVTGTVNVLAAAREHDVRAVLTGSIEEPRPGNEFAPPSSAYAMSKWAATGYARLYHRLWDLPVTVLRPSMVYGPAQPDTTKLVPYVTLCLLRGEQPRLTRGTKLADWIYVDDVVDAYVLAGESDKAIGHALDIGTGVRTPAYEIVERLYRITGTRTSPEFGAAPDRPHDIPQVGDIAPAADRLGWHPVTELHEGLRRTVNWYASQECHE